MARVPKVREETLNRPPAVPGGRIIIRETLDGLGIYNPARRNIPLLLFLSLWLCGWAAGEYFALSEILYGGNIVGTIFMSFWGTLWTIGGLACILIVLWSLVGSERLFVTGGALVHSVGLGFLRYRRIYPASAVRDLRVLDSGDPGNNAAPLAAVAFDAGDRTCRFGMGMSRLEAEAVLKAIRRMLPPADEPAAEVPPVKGAG